jgi:hypothetical protein
MAFLTFSWARHHAGPEFLFNDTRQARRVQTASLPPATDYFLTDTKIIKLARISRVEKGRRHNAAAPKKDRIT